MGTPTLITTFKIIFIVLCIIALILLFNNDNDILTLGTIGCFIGVIGLLHLNKKRIINGSFEDFFDTYGHLKKNYYGIFYPNDVLNGHEERDVYTRKELRNKLFPTFKQLWLAGTPPTKIYEELKKNNKQVPEGFKLLDVAIRSKIYDPQNRPELIDKIKQVNDMIVRRNNILSNYIVNTKDIKNQIIARDTVIQNIQKYNDDHIKNGKSKNYYLMHSKTIKDYMQKVNSYNVDIDQMIEINKTIEKEYTPLYQNIDKAIKEHGFKKIPTTTPTIVMK